MNRFRHSKKRFLYFFLPVVITIALAFPSISYADEVSTGPEQVSATIDDSLPYPGLLPGHPFYLLKTSRDIISGFLISDPLKKAEFDLLQANKRVEASYLLLEKDTANIDISVTTFSKALNYFEDATIKADEAKSQGIENCDFLKQLSSTIKIYQLKLHAIEQISGKEYKKYAKEKKRIDDFDKKVKELSTKK